MPSLFHIRKHLAAPLAWLMVLAMLSPLSPHLAEGVALCIGEGGHVGVEATGAAHHESDSEREAPLAPAREGTGAPFAQSSPDDSPGASLVSADAPEAPSPDECSDIPLRVVQPGDACYQAVQASGGPDVPPLLVSQVPRFARASDAPPSAPSDSDARERRRSPRAATPSSLLASSTVVLLI